jgi:hypothetical protein
VLCSVVSCSGLFQAGIGGIIIQYVGGCVCAMCGHKGGESVKLAIKMWRGEGCHTDYLIGRQQLSQYDQSTAVRLR